MNPKPQTKLFWLGFCFMTAALGLMGLRLFLSFETEDKQNTAKAKQAETKLINNLYKGRDLSHLRRDKDFKIPPAEKMRTAQHYKPLAFAPLIGNKNGRVKVDLFLDFSKKDALRFLRDFQPLLSRIQKKAQIRIYSFNKVEINSIVQLAADKSDFKTFYKGMTKLDRINMESLLGLLLDQGMSMADIRNALKQGGADYYGEVVQMTELKDKLYIPNKLKNSPALLFANGYLFGTSSLSYDDFESSVNKLMRHKQL